MRKEWICDKIFMSKNRLYRLHMETFSLIIRA